MEYYDYNSNQQKQQEEHNKRELYKIKSVVDNWHNSKDISLYINNVLINFNAACFFDSSVNKVCISNLRLLDNKFIQELKDNFEEEIIDFNQNNKFVFEYRLNYFSKLLNKQINHYVQFIPNYSFDNIVDSDYLIRFKTDFLINVFRKEIFVDILLFLYENAYFNILYISDDKTSYDYNESLEEYMIKSLSEKRRMKTLIENF
jgi:hypothetical protein